MKYKKILATLFFLIVSPLFFVGSISAQDSCAGIISTDEQYFACCASAPAESFCGTYRTFVRTSSRCSNVTDQATYQFCCTGNPVNQSACLAFNESSNTGGDGGGTTGEDSCEVIDNQAEYEFCCRVYTPDNTPQCSAYIGNINTGGGGNGPGTNPTGGGGTTGTGGGGGATGAAVGECSAIRFRSLLDILIWVKCIITAVVIPLIFSLATLFFFWNVTVFIRTSDNKIKKEEARQRMVWGILALFIMLSVWGIISIMSNLFGISPSVPLLQTEVYLDPSNASQQ